MKTQARAKRLSLILVSAVLAAPTTGYGQAPSLVASTSSPLTEATLDGARVALLLSGGVYARSISDVRDAVTVSGIAGVTIDRVGRLGDTAVTVVLDYSGHLGTAGTLTFTVGAQAIANYDGPALTAELPVTAAAAPVTASTPFGLWESSLNGTVVTLTLVGRSYERADIRSFVAVSGLTGVTVNSHFGIKRASDTEVTVELTYLGDFVAPMAADGTLTFTVQAQAIAGYDGPALTAELPVMAGIGPFSHDPDKDFNTLAAAGNTAPQGIWSDGTTMWVADNGDDKIYAYDMTTRARDHAGDFNTLYAAGNRSPGGLWSDGVTLWVSNPGAIYAHDRTTTVHVPDKDFDWWTLRDTGIIGNVAPWGLWSDGTTMWVTNAEGVTNAEDGRFSKIYAYELTTRIYDRQKDFNTLRAAGNKSPRGLWSDGATLWVADSYDDKIYAYSLFTRARDPDKDFNALAAAGNTTPQGIWSDGTTMWVADPEDDKLYAYKMPSGSLAEGAKPDLVVQSPAVSNRTPTAGASFTLSVTVRNHGSGQSPATTLRFYRSTGGYGTISTSDTQVGSQPVSGLAASGSSDHSIDLIAPPGSGVHWYGACIVSVSEEHTTDNNCSFAVAVVFGREPARDFDTIEWPWGLWSDGVTMWVADDDKIYAYDMTTRARDPGKDLEAAGNDDLRGIWSDGTTMWVADDDKIYAYDLTTGARDPGKDFDTLEAANNNYPGGIWSDGTTMWVVERGGKIYAYNLFTKARDPGKDFDTLEAADNDWPEGIWSDGTTMWVVDYSDGKIYAYSLSTKVRDPGKDFDSPGLVGNKGPRGLWSDGTTMWVADSSDGKLYAYSMPSDLADAGGPEDTAAPDLVVQSPSVSDGSPTIGASFTLSATVRNRGSGQSPATTLRFYRSTDGTISTSDTEVGSQTVGALAASGTGTHLVDLTAPSDAGTYYYGACVESVSGETDTGNNCSPAAAVDVAPETPAASGADFNGDGTVDFADFFEFVDAFDGSDPRYDLNGDGTVDFADFFEFVDNWGQSGQAKLVAMAQEMIGLPEGPQLQQNVPNPFNSETVVSWFLLEPGPARVEVFALTGQRVAVLHQRSAAGRLPPHPLGRPRRWGPRPGQRGIPLPAGECRRRTDAQAHPAAVVRTRRLPNPRPAQSEGLMKRLFLVFCLAAIDSALAALRSEDRGCHLPEEWRDRSRQHHRAESR